MDRFVPERGTTVATDVGGRRRATVGTDRRNGRLLGVGAADPTVARVRIERGPTLRTASLRSPYHPARRSTSVT